MPSIFSRIISGEIPCYQVAEDDQHIAFLDVSPLAAGHTLVVPKHEQDYLFDMNDGDYLALQLFAKKVAIALRKAIPCKRIGVAVIGLEVPHVHIHLVPLNEVADINFSREKLKPQPEELAAIQKLIKTQFAFHR